MVSVEKSIARHLAPIFAALTPGADTGPVTSARNEDGSHDSTAEYGHLHCGQHGAGHFVKMVHNGIEYGLMTAYAAGLDILRNANIGTRSSDADVEATPLRNPEYYQYTFESPWIVEVWRRGSVIGSWLLNLTTNALQDNPASV